MPGKTLTKQKYEIKWRTTVLLLFCITCLPICLSCCASGFVIREERVYSDTIDFTVGSYVLGPGDVVRASFRPALSGIDGGSYQLEQGDAVKIEFYSNPELNRETTILPDGMVNVPPKGTIRAGGLTPAELADTISRHFAEVIREPSVYVTPMAYQQAAEDLMRSITGTDRNDVQVAVGPDGILRFPFLDTLHVMGMDFAVLEQKADSILHERYPSLNISLTLAEAKNNNVYVFGEVSDPGTYPLATIRTLVHALAEAGVDMDVAGLRSVLVISRTEDGKPLKRIVDVRRILRRGNVTEDLFLRQFDVIFVPKTAIAKANLFIRQYISNMIPPIFRIAIGAQYDLATLE
ncbi:MAG: hypothetical protein GF344_03540 [Chitinivibrionales bacterium]|nr:hypothetical protein [Chitinivibrionales bacterium]MBD3356144.1 hypothetical protein [Chitinivibrionales bacterium]